MFKLIASVFSNGKAIELDLNPQNTYTIVLVVGSSETTLARNVTHDNLRADLSVIIENDARLQNSDNRLKVIQD